MLESCRKLVGMKISPPSFEEWVAYCFTQGWADFHARAGSPEYEQAQLRTQRFANLEPALLARYVIRLFRDPAAVAARYADNQIGNATWFLFGVASGYFQYLPSDPVPRDLQIECIASVATLYTDLFDRFCCKRGAEPDGDFRNELTVDGAVYMIWDMDCIECAAMFPNQAPHLVDPSFAALETVLAQCRTSTCQVSALHGLGHLHMYHPQRVERIIDDFLISRSTAMWVCEYACNARKGSVL